MDESLPGGQVVRESFLSKHTIVQHNQMVVSSGSASNTSIFMDFLTFEPISYNLNNAF